MKSKSNQCLDLFPLLLNIAQYKPKTSHVFNILNFLLLKKLGLGEVILLSLIIILVWGSLFTFNDHFLEKLFSPSKIFIK